MNFKSQKPLSILIVSGPFPDSKSVFLNLKIMGLARRGHTVYVLSKRPGNKTRLREIRKSEPDLKLFPQPSLKSRNKWFNSLYRCVLFPNKLVKALIISPHISYSTLRDIFTEGVNRVSFYKLCHQLNLIILSQKAQIINFEWNNHAVNYLEALKYIQKPVVVSIRGRGISSQPLVNKELASKLPLLFNRADCIHSISKDLVERGKPFGVKEDKVVLVTPAIDLSKFTPPEERDYNERPLRIITVAHLVWKKHILGAIHAVKILVERGYDVTYTVIGEGSEREPLT